MSRKPKLVHFGSGASARLALAGKEPPEPPKSPPGVGLMVITGRELGRRYDLRVGSTTIGRDASSDVCLVEEGVSRNQATIVRDDTGIAIRDEGSTNGTYLNGERIKEAMLAHGDVIQIGRSVLKVLDPEDVADYHEEIYRLSTTDGMTQVFNRRYFNEALARELERARENDVALSIVMVDVDHLARCNEEHGHSAGDHVLRRLAALLTEHARSIDVVARYGGEEFCAILPEAELARAAEFAEAIRTEAENDRFAFNEQHIPVTVSLGVAELAPEDADATALIHRAEAAMHQAKRLGRNRVAQDPPND